MRYLLSIGLVFALLAPLSAAELYVSPNGDDANPGTRDKPLATLAGARDAVRKLRGATARPTTQPATPVTVYLAGGRYFITRTVELDARDGGAEGSEVVYRALPGQTPILVGGPQIKNFVPHKDKILKADLAGQGWKKPEFRQLLCDSKRQVQARYPNYDPADPVAGGWAYVDGPETPMYATPPTDSPRHLVYKPQDQRTWADASTGEVFIFPRYNWWNNIVPIASDDRAKRTLTLGRNASYAIRPGDRYYVQGLLEELDAPGEWHLDRKSAVLYYWPAQPIEQCSVTAPAVDTILRVSGAAHVVFQGLTLECSEESAIVMRDCRDCRVAGCTIRQAGWYNGSGVSIIGRSTRCGVVGCDISHVGSAGVTLHGGDRPTLSGGANYADNNYIHHTGVYYKQGSGVAMHGVGHRASHNLIHDCPRFAVLFGGNNLVIEYNRCRHLSLETADTGAFYTGGRDWISSRGTVIRHNFIHDVIGFGLEKGKWTSPHYSWGVYLDDNAGGVDVVGNIIARAWRAGVHLHNGRDNLIENNIIIDCELQQFECNGWTDKHSYWINHLPSMIKGYESVASQPAWKNMRNMDLHPSKAVQPDGKIMTGNRFVRNILYWHKPQSKLYSLRTVPFAKYESDYNVIHHFALPLGIGGLKAKDPAAQWEEWTKMGFEKHSVIADPLFVDADKDDYRLKADSPALKLGFKPIPVEKIGPYAHPLRASWPIVEAPGARERMRK